MKTFRQYFDQKMRKRTFKALYNQECHVCAKTIQILDMMESRGLALEQVARELDLNPNCLKDLYHADYCDPHLVVRLCRLLGESPPDTCPRRP